jgi:hypothetical protein
MQQEMAVPDFEAALDDDIADDLLRLEINEQQRLTTNGQMLIMMGWNIALAQRVFILSPKHNANLALGHKFPND